MKALSTASYAPYAAIGVLIFFIILMLILSSNIKNGIRASGLIIKYSSMIMIIGSIAAIIVAIKPNLLFQPIFNDPVMSIFFDKVLFITSLHILIPILVIFSALSFIGGIFSKIGKTKS
jgi:predicted aconitase with swiveling domain